MVVIGHRAIIPALDVIGVHDVAQDEEELSIVGVVEKDAHPTIAPGQHVPKQTWSLDTFVAGHGGRLIQYSSRAELLGIPTKDRKSVRDVRRVCGNESAQRTLKP